MRRQAMFTLSSKPACILPDFNDDAGDGDEDDDGSDGKVDTSFASGYSSRAKEVSNEVPFVMSPRSFGCASSPLSLLFSTSLSCNLCSREDEEEVDSDEDEDADEEVDGEGEVEGERKGVNVPGKFECVHLDINSLDSTEIDLRMWQKSLCCKSWGETSLKLICFNSFDAYFVLFGKSNTIHSVTNDSTSDSVQSTGKFDAKHVSNW